MKPKPNSLWAALKPAQRDDLMSLLIDQGEGYAKAMDLCKTWKVRTSISALSRFYNQHGFAWRLERAKAAAAATEGTTPESIEESKARLLSQKIFEAIADPACPPKVLIALRNLEVKREALKLAERRVAVLEAKISDAKAILDNTAASPAERERKLKAIFGM